MARSRRHQYHDPLHCTPAIRDAILARAGHCCEGSPVYPRCRGRDGSYHPVSHEWVQLTLVQLDLQPGQDSMTSLRAWCQRCRRAYHRARWQARRTQEQREMEARQLVLPF